MKNQNLVAIQIFLVFFKKEIKFTLKNFWPKRTNAKGFSIENLARKYREKISSSTTNKSLNELVKEKNLNTFHEDKQHTTEAAIPINRGHWANRDFSEYREAA